MNKFYLITPIVLLTVFVIFQRGAKSEIEQHKAQQEATAKAEKAAEEARRLEIEKKASAEAADRQAKRDAEEEAKRKKREQDYLDAMAKLASDTAAIQTDSDKYTKEINKLEIDLLNARSQRDKTSKEAFDLSKEVEMAKVSRRSAELEIQRLIDMVGSKATSSPLAVIPTPPPAKK